MYTLSQERVEKMCRKTTTFFNEMKIRQWQPPTQKRSLVTNDICHENNNNNKAQTNHVSNSNQEDCYAEDENSGEMIVNLHYAFQKLAEFNYLCFYFLFNIWLFSSTYRVSSLKINLHCVWCYYFDNCQCLTSKLSFGLSNSIKIIILCFTFCYNSIVTFSLPFL